ncbi:hypothetical protein CYMTET_36542 [Cymbomonas tetramitiformis]|uniref:Uncharacterized protein n=1 Tax=Cymbomonas tetramitiformis TaxID=36881 RepID=A0AAE0CH38_9CHLO|nr:hypothetical protein CYMTET_36542 [Cymbomonas tetramitiformis]
MAEMPGRPAELAEHNSPPGDGALGVSLAARFLRAQGGSAAASAVAVGSMLAADFPAVRDTDGFHPAKISSHGATIALGDARFEEERGGLQIASAGGAAAGGAAAESAAI